MFCSVDKYGKMNRSVLFDRQLNRDKSTNSTGLINFSLIS